MASAITILQELRMLVVYPVLTISGLVWLVGFWLRWRHTRCTGDRWCMIVGAGMLAMGGTGMAALWISGIGGFTAVTSSIFTVGLMALTIIGGAGALRLFLGAWRLSGREHDAN